MAVPYPIIKFTSHFLSPPFLLSLTSTLQKFKLLATQFAVAAGSPTRSQTTSPVIHLCRRKTLRMLLTRSGNATSDGGSDRLRRMHRRIGFSCDGDSPDKKKVVVRNKLKDLFVSSPENSREGFSPEISSAGGSIGSAVRRIRPLTATVA